MDFQKQEAFNGTRWSWNVLPSTTLDQSRMIVPVGCMYTPLKEISGMPVLQYEPVCCKTCKTVLNPMSRCDFRTKTWACPICFTRNAFPNAYYGVDETHLPAELYPQLTTVEYVLNRKPAPPPCFLFVIDTCINTDELEVLVDSILQTLDSIPPNSVVGLVTFGATVQVYELNYAKCTKAYVFRGDKEPTIDQVQEQLGLRKTLQTQTQQQQQPKLLNPQTAINSRFLIPLEDCEATLTTILQDLQVDPWPVKEKTRAKRCTGVAMSIAASMLEIGYTHFGARMINFIGGPCTLGPGTVVSTDLKEQMRFHNDLRSDKAPYFKKAVEHYNSIAQRIVKNGHACDVFSANLDQCGVMELKACCENTGGDLVLTDTFNNQIFQESFRRYFKLSGENQNLSMGFNGTLEVKCSPEIKIAGALGPITSMNKQSPYVGETEIGYGKTNTWKINAFHPTTSVTMFFDVATKTEQTISDQQNQFRYFQFATQYQHSSGQYRLRVTTQALRWVPTNSWSKISLGFDQEASAVLMARYSAFKAESEHLFDVLRWLDRSLIRVLQKFGSFEKGNINSLSISSNFSMFPQFLYHLRRSQFLRVFNTSPDETTFYRLALNRETVSNTIIMIQPTLFSYSLQDAPHPVLLDAVSVTANNILLLDSYFHVLIHSGETIAEWRDAGYHLQEQYAHFKRLMEIPKEDCQKLLVDRYPYPKVLECDQYGSDSRILMAKVNPSTTHHSEKQGYNESGGQKVLTDDASLQDFMAHLKKLIVE
eukprot:gene5477-9295_t